MRKRILAGIISVLAIATFIAGIIYYDTHHVTPIYYNDIGIHLELDKEEWDKNRDVKTPITQNEEKIVENVLMDLCELYNVSKEMPKVAHYKPNNGIEAQYDDECIYVDFKAETNKLKADIAHELVHYLTDKGNGTVGFMYTLDSDKNYCLGSTLTEGFTEYFSSKYAKHEQTYYPYEVHVAKMLVLCYGETLQNDFFEANIDNLRNDFNKCLKKYYQDVLCESIVFTPFDIFNSSLGLYRESANYDIRNNSAIQLIDEMMLFYAHCKGCEGEIVNEIEVFADENDVPVLKELINSQASRLIGKSI